ncbi:hypothetical protein EMIT0111MI5_90060 [Burkholderia sp. IT-111MI5]
MERRRGIRGGPAARRRRLRALGQQQDGRDRPDDGQMAEHRRRPVQLVDQRRLCERAVAAGHRDGCDVRLRPGRRRRELQQRAVPQRRPFAVRRPRDVQRRGRVHALERAAADATVRRLQLYARQRCRWRRRPRAVSQRHARRRLRPVEAHQRVPARRVPACIGHDARCARPAGGRDRVGVRQGEWPFIGLAVAGDRQPRAAPEVLTRSIRCGRNVVRSRCGRRCTLAPILSPLFFEETT